MFFGDLKAWVYAVDAQTGALIWKVRADEHAFARITGAPTFSNDRLIVSVSSFEEGPAARPNYPCCTFRGSVLALDAVTGKKLWHTYMIAEEPKVVGKNATGTPLWKPAGVAVWSSPTIDAAKNTVYVGTGNSYTEPRSADERCDRRARHARQARFAGSIKSRPTTRSSSAANPGT